MPDLSLHHIYIPPRLLAQDSSPAIFLFHGLGSDEYELLALASDLPDELAVISVRAPFPYEIGGYKWYDRDPTFNLNPTAVAEISGRMGEFLAGAVEEYPIDAERLYLFGFSMGSVVAMTTMLAVPDRVAGAIALSGFLPEDNGNHYQVSEARGKPIFVGHGIQDPVVPIAMGRAARERLLEYGVDLTYREYPVEHTLSEEEWADVRAWLASRLQG
jgi:phospholipase/carboxylesterase